VRSAQDTHTHKKETCFLLPRAYRESFPHPMINTGFQHPNPSFSKEFFESGEKKFLVAILLEACRSHIKGRK